MNDSIVFNSTPIVSATGANASVIYVPAAFAADAVYEATEAGIKLIVCITEGVPALDMVELAPYVKASGARLVGPVEVELLARIASVGDVSLARGALA